MIVAVAPADADRVTAALRVAGESPVLVIGEAAEGDREVQYVA